MRKIFLIEHKIILTMIDTKICNIITFTKKFIE